MKKQLKNSTLVYSTEYGKICPDCGKPIKKCLCSQHKNTAQIKNDGIVRLSRETKGRKGKGVTLISGIPLDTKELKNIAKSLKKKCGCGGSLKNGIIEIQGDHRDTLEKELASLGYKIKRAGA